MSRSLLNFARYATSDRELLGVLATVDLTRVDVREVSWVQQAGTPRLPVSVARRLWKNARCAVMNATLVATWCADPDLLLDMAAKESRQGPLSALATNPATPLEALLLVLPSLHYSGGLNQVITELIHDLPVTSELTVLADKHKVAQAALFSHPGMTDQVLLERLQEAGLAGQEQPSEWVLARPDLASFPLTLEFLLTQVQDNPRAQRSRLQKLARRPDLALFPLALWETLASSPAAMALPGHDGMPLSIVPLLVRNAQRLSQAQDDKEANLWLWNALADLPEVSSEDLLCAPVHPWTLPVLARLLRERFPDHPSAWEVTSGVLENLWAKDMESTLLVLGALLE